MNCDQYQESANLFLDGELDVQSEVELFRHISHCEECRSFVDVMSRISSVKDAEKIQFPPALDDKLFTRLAGSRRGRPARSSFIGMFRREIAISLPLAAALVVILLFGGMLFGLLLRGVPPYGENPVISARQPQAGQPATVILFYELPPIEVVGKPVLKEARYDKNYNP